MVYQLSLVVVYPIIYSVSQTSQLVQDFFHQTVWETKKNHQGQRTSCVFYGKEESGVPCQKLTAHIYPWKTGQNCHKRKDMLIILPTIDIQRRTVSFRVFFKNIVDKFIIDMFNFMKPKFDWKHCELHIKHIQKQCFGWDGSLGICLLKSTDLSRRGDQGHGYLTTSGVIFSAEKGAPLRRQDVWPKIKLIIGDSKWPVDPPIWTSLNPWKGLLTVAKRVQRIARQIELARPPPKTIPNLRFDC